MHIAYFDEHGTLRRHDCSSDTGGIVPGATFASRYQLISGLSVALTRQVYAHSRFGVRDGPVLVEVNLSDVQVN
jgi:hypothetical protein